MKDRIQPNPEGTAFTYQKTPSPNSQESEQPVPPSNIDLEPPFMPEDDELDNLEDLDNAFNDVDLEEFDQKESLRASFQEMPPIVAHDESTNEDVETPKLGFPEAKLPSMTTDSTDIPDDAGFATVKQRRGRGRKPKPNEEQTKKQTMSIPQKLCQVISPKYAKDSSSSGSYASSSSNKSLAAKSDTSRKSTNTFAALQEFDEQDFRQAESG